MRNGTNQMCLFWAKNNFDRLLWGKQEGDGRQLTMFQSMGSGFSAACFGPFATGPFDVVKVGLQHIPQALRRICFLPLLQTAWM